MLSNGPKVYLPVNNYMTKTDNFHHKMIRARKNHEELKT